MHKRHQRCFEVLLCFIIFGCTFTEKSVNKPKMFDGDFEKLKALYEKIRPDFTTWQQLVQMGFAFEDSNIEVFAGARAFKFIFGEDVFQGAARARGELDQLLDQLNLYRAVIIPHRDIKVVRDRIYFTSRETFSQGHDARFILLFQGEMVRYKTHDIENVDKYELAKAWGQGVLDFIGLAREATKLPNPKTPDALKN